jgi:DNA-binding XRE family transcriptional regulator
MPQTIYNKICRAGTSNSKVTARRETIVFLEKGKYNPSLKLAYDISRVFDITIQEVFIFDSQKE